MRGKIKREGAKGNGDSTLSTCVAASITARRQVDFEGNYCILISGLPQSCITEVEA